MHVTYRHVVRKESKIKFDDERLFERILERLIYVPLFQEFEFKTRLINSCESLFFNLKLKDVEGRKE